jgi:tyrosyl-tRNA synthetase
MRSPLLQELEDRGLVSQCSTSELHQHFGETNPPREVRTVYVGFDPTADSLHVGSLLPLLALRRIQLAGHRPIVLVGGGTGLIGDPSGKTGERALNPADQVAEWAERLKTQARPFLDFGSSRCSARVVDNYVWLSELQVIPFLRDIGKHFPVGAMVAKESVRSRMGRADTGISYTEFSYQILQAYDFLKLAETYDCTVQVGGSDQWGNITAGIELIRRVKGWGAYGLTLPLVTKEDGTKFGKTETGTIWLDPAKTSAYEMYQFWLNTADADVARFLKYFTFRRAVGEIDALVRRAAQAPEQREAQRTLAREVTELVHGAEKTREAEEISAALFRGDVAGLSERQIEEAFRGVPTTVFPTAHGDAVPVVDLLVRTGLSESKRVARELIAAGAVHVNGRRVEDAAAKVSRVTALYGRYLILRKGKRTYHVVVIQ